MSDFTLHRTGEQTAGYCLRELRERKGLTLEDAARVTRLSKAYLAAIEEDQYEKLPSEAYARGFLRIYARYLGLGDVEIAALCPDASTESSARLEEEPSPLESDHPADTTRLFPRKWIIPSLFVVAASTVIFFSTRGAKVEHTATSVNVPQRQASSSALPLQGVLSSSRAGNTPPPAHENKSEKPFNTQALREKGAILKLKALADGALDVAIDDMASQHYELKAGDLFEWKGERVFSLDLEDAGGVEVELNGKVIEPLGERGEPAHVVLKAEDSSAETAP